VASPSSHAYTFHDVADPKVQSVGLYWSNIIISMARFGNPNDGRSDTLGWPQYAADERSCLVVDEVSRVAKDLDSFHSSLWQSPNVD
jgi:carboxylesterase type B